MCVEFVVSSRCSKSFSPGSPVFLPPQKLTPLNSNLIWTSKRTTRLLANGYSVLPCLDKVFIYYYYYYHYGSKNYIGLTEGTFKQRYTQHKATFKNRRYTNSTELSNHIWNLRDNNQNFNIKWSIISRARPYNNISKRCDLCLTEKLMIITLNKTSY